MILSSETTLDTNDFERFDAGIAAGVGLDFELLSFGVRYNYGLTKVGKERNFEVRLTLILMQKIVSLTYII
jgi:hypothetical protein